MRDADPEKWNLPADKTVAAIRRLNPTRKIIIGSTCRNSVNTLCKLKIYDDENIIYTFHTYYTISFMHQRGVLQPDTVRKTDGIGLLLYFVIRISVSELDGTVLAAGAVMRHPDIKQAFICHKLAAVIIIAELLLGNAYCNAFAFSRIKLSS